METTSETKQEKIKDFFFKIKVYLYYLVVEPWTSQVRIPNLRSLSWVFIFIAFLFRNFIIEMSFATLGVLLYLIYEFKEGKYLYWYRSRKYKEHREALKKVREHRKLLSNSSSEIQQVSSFESLENNK